MTGRGGQQYGFGHDIWTCLPDTHGRCPACSWTNLELGREIWEILLISFYSLFVKICLREREKERARANKEPVSGK